ncbi:hypothetical protein BMG03_10150 [Thioclava nitratireducens]|uniref:Helix-turn-helix domain-containing protein n=1 Tax=Thioclava nitratireducens TaxID=1915078 RepID=A0ABM6ILN3_9RHOB|nr:hypothetical protein BMG03_10150 [Thioclava nitratireducens]
MRRYCETDELAVRFRRHTRTIRDRIQKGCPVNGRRLKLPATRLGKKWQVREDWLVLFEHEARPPIGRPGLDRNRGVVSAGARGIA